MLCSCIKSDIFFLQDQKVKCYLKHELNVDFAQLLYKNYVNVFYKFSKINQPKKIPVAVFTCLHHAYYK